MSPRAISARTTSRMGGASSLSRAQPGWGERDPCEHVLTLGKPGHLRLD